MAYIFGNDLDMLTIVTRYGAYQILSTYQISKELVF